MIEKELNTIEAKEQMKSVVEYMETCICCLNEKEFPLKAHTVGISKIDEEGNFWFVFNKSKHSNVDITTATHLELIYSEPGQAHLLTVYGTVSVAYDRRKLEEVWTHAADELFESGINDPNIILLKVMPTEAFYYRGSNFGHFVMPQSHAKAA